MRKKTLILFIIAFLNCTSTESFIKNSDSINSIKTIAIIPFKSSSMDVGYTLSDAIANNLINSRFNIIERSQLENILAEYDLNIKGVIDNPELLYGKIKGVDALLIGSVTIDRGFAGIAYGVVKDYISSATARLVKVTDGSVIMGISYSADSPSTMEGVTSYAKVGKKIANEIINKL